MKKKYRKRLIRALLHIASKKVDNVDHLPMWKYDYRYVWLWNDDRSKLRIIDKNLYDSIKSLSKFLANKPNKHNYI